MGNFEEKLCLSNVCAGALEEEFQRYYQLIMKNLKEGEKASIDIKLNFKRIEDTATMVSLDYKIVPKLPGKSKASICQVTMQNELLTDKVPEKLDNVTIDEYVDEKVLNMRGNKK